ncbi:MAG TPA: DUF4249 family protein, partial [Saprospiraceae bacterium]|nr:DUF4249 family protein [Saprospiraceae bacterium]
AIDLTAGQTYELKVSADNFETTTAEQIMPTKPILKDAEYRQAKNKLHVTISDDSGRDFYVLGISPNGTSNDVGGYLYSETGIAEDSGLDYRRVIFGDDTFSEQDVALTLEASVNGAGSGTDSVRVYLYNVTEDYYRLDRGVNAADNADENPFAEPVILHRNFDKGFGVFALGNKASVVIPVE